LVWRLKARIPGLEELQEEVSLSLSYHE
jgi:hypothetical protein